MKNHTTITLMVCLVLLSDYTVSGQGSTIWEEIVISTGRTTGHIATLNITNYSGYDVPYHLPAGIIPSSGNGEELKTQPMYCKPVNSTTIPTGGQSSIPLYGYCLDIFKPPVEEGGLMPPPYQWITPGIIITGPPPTEIQYIDIPYGTGLIPLDLTSPLHGNDFTHRPVHGTFDLTYYPQTAAPYIFSAISAIEETYYDLKEDGLIKTPFSGDTARESGAVLQQTIWVYTSLLENKTYVRDDFRGRLFTQFEQQSGQAPTSAQTQQLEKGTDQFWDTFVLVGTQAKVLRQLPIDIPIETPMQDTIPNCVLSYQELIGYKMDGGLAGMKYISADEEPVPGKAFEQWASAENGIILCADGYDADLFMWDCTPDAICIETKSENVAMLTSCVKFKWELSSGTGHFSNFRRLDEGECVIYSPIPLSWPSEDQPAITETVELKLFIEDACSVQPLDPTVIKVITIMLSQSHGAPLMYKIKGPVFRRNNNFQLPTSGIITGLAQGSCEAILHGWDHDRDIYAAIELPKDTLRPGQFVKLNAQDIKDFDELFISCRSACREDRKWKNYPDNLEWKWEILSGGGLLYSKFNIDGGNEAYGRSIIFQAPKIEEAISHVNIKLTVFNPETLQEVDKEAELIFEVPVRCVDKEISPSVIWLSWTDQPVDAKDSVVAKKKEIWNGILLRLVPPDCTPKVSDNMVIHTETQDDKSHTFSAMKVLKPQQRLPEDSEFKPTRSWTFMTERNDGCVQISNLTLYGGFEVGFFDLFLPNERLVFMNKIFREVFPKLFALDNTLDEKFRDVYGNLLWLILMYGFQNIENTPEYQKIKEMALEKGLTEKDFEKVKDGAEKIKKEYDEKHGQGSFDKLFITTNPIFKDHGVNLIYSVWEICTQGHSCSEVCQIRLYGNTKSTRNEKSDKVERDSTITHITIGSAHQNTTTYTHTQ